MAKIRPATWISSKKNKAKLWLTRLKPNHENSLDLCALPPGVYTIRSRREEYLLEIAKSSVAVKKKKDTHEHLNLKEFKKVVSKFLNEGWEKLTHDETEDLSYNAHFIIHNEDEFTKEDFLIAKLVYEHSGVIELHNELSTALAGDLYLKDLNQTNETFVKALTKVGRWRNSSVEHNTKYGKATAKSCSDSGEWSFYEVELKEELVPEDKKQLFTFPIKITVRQWWDETLDEAIEKTIMNWS